MSDGISDRLTQAVRELDRARSKLESFSRRRATHARVIADALLHGASVSPQTLDEYGELVRGDVDAREQWRSAFDIWSLHRTQTLPPSSAAAPRRGTDVTDSPMPSTGGSPMPQSVFHLAGEPCETVQMPHSFGTADQARIVMAGQLRAAGLQPNVVVDAEIVLTELVHNAVEHGRPVTGGAIEISWCVRDARIRITVTDGGQVSRLVPLPTSEAKERGRGLSTVDQLCQRWDHDNQHGTRVTADLAVI